MQLLIDPTGAVKCIYGEAIELSTFGNLKIARGSHVEPDEAGQWWADMSPVSGPQLGPFENRSQALSAEIAWLEAYWLQPIART
jgi:hypothetical protein